MPELRGKVEPKVEYVNETLADTREPFSIMSCPEKKRNGGGGVNEGFHVDEVRGAREGRIATSV